MFLPTVAWGMLREEMDYHFFNGKVASREREKMKESYPPQHQ